MNTLNKIPHWLFALVYAFAGGFVGYLQQQEPNVLVALTSWPSLEPILVGAAMAGLASLIAQAKQSWLPPSTSMLLAIGLTVTSVAACKPPSAPVVGPAIETVTCILATVSADVAKKVPWEQAVADTIANCGTDAATIATVWGAHVHAEAVEGFVPRMLVPAGAQ